MDVYRHLSTFLNIKDFLSLTSCNKNLRRLYFEKGTIWKSFLERDFFYKYHPSYDVERYKVCFQRKNINFSQSNNNHNGKLVYIDFDKVWNNLLENWGLVHSNRPIISVNCLYLLYFCTSIFVVDYVTSETIDLFSYLVRDDDNNIKYVSKSYDLLYEIYQLISIFDSKILNDPQQILPTVECCKNHSDYNKAYLMWQELGF